MRGATWPPHTLDTPPSSDAPASGVSVACSFGPSMFALLVPSSVSAINYEVVNTGVARRLWRVIPVRVSWCPAPGTRILSTRGLVSAGRDTRPPKAHRSLLKRGLHRRPTFALAAVASLSAQPQERNGLTGGCQAFSRAAVSQGCIPKWVANLGLWSLHAARWMGREAQNASHDRLIRWPIRAVIAKAPPSLHCRPLPFRRCPTSCLHVDSMIPEPMTSP